MNQQKKPLASATTILVLTIIGAVLTIEGVSAVAGLILFAIAVGMINEYKRAGVLLTGTLKASSVIAPIGMWISFALTAVATATAGIATFFTTVSLIVSFFTSMVTGFIGALVRELGIIETFFEKLFASL